jgi:hypothetical protein
MFITLLVSACNKIDWKEEVKLQSGEIIVVERTAKAKSFGELGGPGGWENMGMTVQIIRPIKSDNPPPWDYKFVPLIFDRDPETKEWFMVATFYTCASWLELGQPKLPYTEFRVKNDGQWHQQALNPDLIGREGNMLTRINSNGEADHTVASKEKINRNPAISLEYKKVIDRWATSCTGGIQLRTITKTSSVGK